MSFIAGPYTCVDNSLSLGQSEDGYHLDFAGRYEEITGDNFADAVQELIWRGCNAYVSTVLLEYNAAGAAGAFWPWHSNVGTVGQVGRVVTSAIGASAAMAKSLILTSVAGTTAASVPTSLTGPLSILAPNMNVGLLFAPRLRRVPIRKILLPNSSGVLFALA